MEQHNQVPAPTLSDAEKMDIILKKLELLAQQVEEIRKEMLRLGAHFQPLIQ